MTALPSRRPTLLPLLVVAGVVVLALGDPARGDAAGRGAGRDGRAAARRAALG